MRDDPGASLLLVQAVKALPPGMEAKFFTINNRQQPPGRLDPGQGGGMFEGVELQIMAGPNGS